ncbi:MAG: ATP-binding cassette domain-containing protein [Pseudomonadota bacterium]
MRSDKVAEAASAASHPGLDVAGLTKTFDATPVLRDLDLSVPPGTFVVILGASGCGKSTFLRCVAGLESAETGTIRIDGQNVDGLEPRDRGCAMVFQNYALYPHMTVEQNIGYGLRVARVPKAERRARVERAAALVELGDLLGRKPAQLSGGQRQRVAMARAIIRDPKVFLFDEPLSNLDARLRVQMRHEIRAIHDRTGATSVFVTYDQVEGLTLADELVVMRDGRIEQIGPPDTVYARPRTAYVARFIGAPAMNVLPARIEGGGLFLPGLDTCLARVDHPDDPILLGIRPENVALDRASAVRAHLRGIENLGALQALHLTLGPEPLVALVRNDHEPIWRDGHVGLGFPPDALHLFDPVTEQRSPALVKGV